MKAITAAAGSYLADQQQKLANGEISEEVALAATVGALIATYKLTPKSVRNQVLDKAGDIVGDVLAVIRGRVPNSTGAENIANAARLAEQLALESARSSFLRNGTLAQAALNNAQMIIPPGGLGNPAIPKGFAKYTTETFQSPSGPFQMYFYKNPTTGQVLYNLDYKAVFNM